MEENPEEKSNPSPLKQIRTYQGDVAEALQRQNESLSSIQQAERARRDAGGEVFHEISVGERTRKEKFFLLLGSLTLLAVGGVGLWYAYTTFLIKTEVPTITAPENRFFSIDTEEKVDVTGSTRLNFIEKVSQATANVPLGETRHFLLNITSTELFKILETRAPGSLARALNPSFMLGSYGQSVFLVLKLNSFENAFAGMLNWEQNLGADIGPLFAMRELLRDSTSTPVFIDVTDRNKDVRALEIGSESVILYSFFDTNMLIITDDIETLRMAIERLERQKLSR